MGLVSVAACPVCEGRRRIPAADGMAKFKKSVGFHYLKHAAASLCITVDDLVNAAQVYQCTTCHSYYCDPWIAPAVASQVFTSGAPDHIAGWGTFEHWISSGNPNAVEQSNIALYKLIQKEIGPLSSYAEFGCPFQGFLLLFKGLEMSISKRITSFAHAMKREPDARWSRVTRWHVAATQWASWAVLLYHRMRAVKEMRGARVDHSVLLQAGSELPAQRVLLTQDTARAWGNNCVRYGASCRYYAARVLGADVLPFQEVVATATGGSVRRYDLLGIFNSLDHTSDPMAVIQGGLKIARHVIVATHHAAYAGKQHQYAFGEQFPEWLKTVLDGVAVRDLTDAMTDAGPRSVNYLLVSNQERSNRD